MRNSEFESEVVVSMQVPRIYSEFINRKDLPPDTDMSRSTKCHVLTLDLLGALRRHGLPARRELHIDEAGNWHYIIAHADESATPKPNDVITDLNPWQFEESGNFKGFLHATREHVQEVMQRANVPEEAIALRGVQTIATPNCERPFPAIATRNY